MFITGASGYIGRALYERFSAAGNEVRGMDLVADANRDVVGGDVGEPGAWQEHAEGSQLVIHTGAIVSFRLERPEEVWRANVLGTANALAAAERCGAERFLHFSSVTVYGFDFPDGVDEDHPPRNTYVPYPDTKIAAEQVVLKAHVDGRMRCVIVRPGDVYGPRARAWSIVPAQLIRSRRFVLPGWGRGIHSPVYIDNLVDAILVASESPAAAGQILNLTDGIGIPNVDFFAPIAELVGRRLICVPTAVALGAAAAVQRAARFTPGDNDVNAASARYLLRTGTYSNAKAREVLGWEPRVGLELGMSRTVDWLREEGYAA